MRKKWNLLPLDLLKKVVLHHDLQPGRTKKELINSLISESIPVLSVAQATSLTTPPSDPSDDSSPDDDLKYPDPDREDIGSGVPLTRDDVAKMIEDTVARFRESDAPRRNCCPSCQSPRTDGQRFCGDCGHPFSGPVIAASASSGLGKDSDLFKDRAGMDYDSTAVATLRAFNTFRPLCERSQVC